MKLLSSTIINERLSSREIVIVSEYVNSKSKAIFRCVNNHEWSAFVNNVLKENGCPHCSNRAMLTKEIVQERIKHKNIEIVGEYLGVNKVTKFLCSFGHIWNTSPYHVMTDTGCPYCSNRAMLTKEIINKRLCDRPFKMMGSYLGMQSKTTFSCNDGHEWTTTPDSIINRETSCPNCASYGFHSTKPAVAYILKFPKFIKYGISNNINSRLNTHRIKNGEYQIIAIKKFSIGKDAIEWEKQIKQTFGGRYATKEQCPDGYTETLNEDKLQMILETLDK